MLERSMKTQEPRRVLWRMRMVSVSPLESCAVALLRHVEESVWSQGLAAPVTAHALRRELDDAFRHRRRQGK